MPDPHTSVPRQDSVSEAYRVNDQGQVLTRGHLGCFLSLSRCLCLAVGLQGVDLGLDLAAGLVQRRDRAVEFETKNAHPH